MNFLSQVFKKAKQNISFYYLKIFLGLTSFLIIVLAGSLLFPDIDIHLFQQDSLISFDQSIVQAQQGGNGGGSGKSGFRNAINTGDDDSILGGIVQNIFTLIIWILFGIAELLQSVALAALELFIQVAEYNNFTNESTVKLGWTMVRDVANMFFIVALLVIAFANILGMENYEMKTTLPRLFLMAILVNFSKLICGVIIDAAHVFTITFLNAVSASAGGNLVGAFGLGELWNSSPEEFNNVKTKAFLSGVYAVIVTLLTAFTIGAYFVMILGRMVVLWILIILSPLAFIANVLPKTQSIAQDWWSRFIRHVLVAPVVVFFLWLAFATLGTGDAGSAVIGEGKQDLPDNATLESVTVGLADWDKLLTFVITVGFLWAGLEVAQNKLGTRGAGAAGKVQSLARSGVRKVANVGKGAAKKAGGIAAKPVTAPAKAVGSKIGESVDRVKRSTKAKLGQAWQEKVQQPRAELAQNLQEEGEGVTGALSTGLGKAIQTGEQAEAATQRREREAKRAEKRHEAYARGGAEAGKTGAEAKERQKRRQQERERASEYGDERSDIIDVAEGRIEGRSTSADDMQITGDAIFAAYQDGASTGEVIKERAAKEAGTEEVGNFSDPEKQVKQFLEGYLGDQLESLDLEDYDGDTELEKADNKLRDELGEQEYRAQMSNLEGQLIAAAKDGRVNNAGIVKDGELNVDLDVEDERTKRASQVNAKEVTDLEHITGEDRNLSDEDHLSRKQLMSFFGSTGKNTTFNNEFKDDMKNLRNEDEGTVRDILGELYQKNKDAAKNINDSIYGGDFDLGEIEEGGSEAGGGEPEGGGTPGGEGPSGGATESEIIEPAGVTSGGERPDYETDVDVEQDTDFRVNMETVQNKYERLTDFKDRLEDMRSSTEEVPEEEINRLQQEIEDLSRELGRNLTSLENRLETEDRYGEEEENIIRNIEQELGGEEQDEE